MDHAKLQGCNSDSDTKSISIHLASFDLPCSSFKDSYSRPYLVNTYILSIEVSLCHGLICRSERLVSGLLGSMHALKYIYNMQIYAIYAFFLCIHSPSWVGRFGKAMARENHSTSNIGCGCELFNRKNWCEEGNVPVSHWANRYNFWNLLVIPYLIGPIEF